MLRDRLVTHYGWRLVRGLDRVFAAQSLVPDTAFIDTADFPWADALVARWPAMRDEALAVLRHRDAIPAFHEISPEQASISVGHHWRTFLLYGFGTRLEQNCRHAPITAAALERVPGLATAWLSILAPGYHIPAHGGVSKGFVRAHLALVVPQEAERCRMRVGDEVRAWRAGELLLFDDSREHEVWNDTDEERVVLVFDVDRPMRPLGRWLHRLFLRLVRRTAFYREPKARMEAFEARFDAAVRAGDDGADTGTGAGAQPGRPA